MTDLPETAPSSPEERVRAICLALPEVEERETWEIPTFRVRNKMFVLLSPRSGRMAVVCKARPGMQSVLVASDPERFFVPAYVGHKGWIGVWIDGAVDWDELTDLITESYVMTAPKLLAALIATSQPDRVP